MDGHRDEWREDRLNINVYVFLTHLLHVNSRLTEPQRLAADDAE